jgi:hypothetical protein
MNTIGKEFIERTKYQYLDLSDQMKGRKSPPLEVEYDHTETLYDLPGPESCKEDKVSIREAIEKRRSIREYSTQPLSIGELSYLLWCTQGSGKYCQE